MKRLNYACLLGKIDYRKKNGGMYMNNDGRTVRFDGLKNEENNVSTMLQLVYGALEEKGYNPINQIVGYLLSGDPAYIPRHNDARNLIRRFERDEVLEELLTNYLKKNDSE